MTSNGDRYAEMTKWVQENAVEMMPDLSNLSPHDYVYCQVPAVSENQNPVEVERSPIIPVPWSNEGSESRHALEKLVASGLQNIWDLKNTMKEYSNGTHGGISAVVEFWNRLETDEEKWENQLLIWKIAKLALRAGDVIKKPLHSLQCLASISSTASVTLSQEQCACILANAFFSTFIHQEGFNDINMHHLFSIENYTALTKLKFIYHYFKCVTDNMPRGCVSFSRRRITGKDQPDWKSLDGKFHSLAVSDANPIEDCPHFLQMDFADMYIGGIIMADGDLQEEIRFLICPEMMVSMLLCPVMKDDEAIFIAGAQRFSSYEGYAKSLKWKPFADYGNEPRDKYGRVRTEIVAIDAEEFVGNNQYTQQLIDRELNKAFVGFYSKSSISSPIATGNWGCGVFNGDRELKSLIQLMAAGQAGRAMLYVPFDKEGETGFGSNLTRIYENLVRKEITIGQLYRILINYNPALGTSVFAYVTAMINK